MSNSVTLSLSEAKKLLGISGNGRPPQHAVEKSYAEKMKLWSPAMNGALTLRDRERAEDVIALLQEAKKLCLTSQVSGTAQPFATISPQPPIYTAQPYAPYFHSPRNRIMGFIYRVRVFIYRCNYAFYRCRMTFLSVISWWKDFIDRFIDILEVIRITVIAIAKICAIPFTLPLSILRNGNDTVGRKIFVVACVVGCLFLLNRFNHHFIEPSGAKESAIINSSVAKTTHRHYGATKASRYSRLLVRSWPASKVTFGRHATIDAPAQKSVKLRAGKQSFYFVPVDQSIKPLKVTVNLRRERSMELRVNLENRKYTLVDKGHM